MRSGLLRSAPSFSRPTSRVASQLERRAESFVRHASCKFVDAARSYQTTSTYARRLPRYNLSMRDYSPLQTALEIRVRFLGARRQKSRKARSEEKDVTGAVLGEDPLLYDKKPRFWGRWEYFALAFAMICTGFSVDMVMRNWKQVVDTTAPSTSSESVSFQQDQSPITNPNDRYQLRPLWHRLALSGVVLSLGVVAGAVILSSRDRIILRLRVQRVPITSLPPARPGMRPPPAAASSSQLINVLALETGSGRKNRFLMRDCILSPGRDLSELILTATAINARFLLSMNGARVLGLTVDHVSDSDILKKLARSKGNQDVSLINYVPGGMDSENVRICGLRELFSLAWDRAGGSLQLLKPELHRSRWTSGPVAGMR